MSYYELEFLKSEHPEPFREFYETYLPELVHRVSNDEGAVPSLHCINRDGHTNGDTHTSAFVALRSGVYGCSVCGHFSAFRFLTDIIGLTKAEASGEISEYRVNIKFFPKHDNFVKHSGHAPKELTQFAEGVAAALNPDLGIVRDYCESRGLDYETLEECGVGYLPESVTQTECLVFPYYLNGRVVAVRGRSNDGRKGGVTGSRFVPYGLDRVTHDSVVLLEGESDTLRAHQALRKSGLPVTAVGVPGAQFRREWEREFTGVERIFVVPQADQPSWQFAEATKEILGDRVTIVKLPWRKGEVGKDLCDWLQIHSELEFISLMPPVVSGPYVIMHSELMKLADQDIPWIIPNLIARGDKVLIGGEQKSMKTYLTLFMIKALVQGLPVLGNPDWGGHVPAKVMFVEEEGALISFAKRVKKVIGNVLDYENNLVWIHRQSIKLDVLERFEKLCMAITEHMPDVVILDPLQRMHSAVEDAAWEMGAIWDKIQELVIRFPQMAVIVIHHYKKGGAQTNDWNSFRGSTRSAGEADVGIFVSKQGIDHQTGETHLKVRVEGRDLPPAVKDEDAGMSILIDTINWEARIGEFLAVSAQPHKQENKTDREKVLEIIAKGGKSTTDIARELDISNTKIGRIVQDLVEKQVVRRNKVNRPDGTNVFELEII